MKNDYSKFITIPAVDAVAASELDPQNQAQVVALIDRAQAYFDLAAKCWEMGNNSGDNQEMGRMARRCERMRGCGARLLAPLGIKCSFPGLYPTFDVSGVDEYETRTAVLTALGHARNFVMPEYLATRTL